jgi:hypothetical protein
MKRAWQLAAAAVMAVGVAAGSSCQSREHYQAEHRARTGEGAATEKVAASAPAANADGGKAAATIGREELRNLLAEMSRSHADKIKLSGWAGTPFLPVGAAFKPFFADMSRSNKELAAELKSWAAKHGMDLTFRYPDTVEGRATELQENRHEKLIRGDKQQDFERDILMDMFSDYEWHAALCKAMLPAVTDAELKTYLQKSLAMYEKGAVEIRMLLKRYKFE